MKQAIGRGECLTTNTTLVSFLKTNLAYLLYKALLFNFTIGFSSSQKGT